MLARALIKALQIILENISVYFIFFFLNQSVVSKIMGLYFASYYYARKLLFGLKILGKCPEMLLNFL